MKEQLYLFEATSVEQVKEKLGARGIETLNNLELMALVAGEQQAPYLLKKLEGLQQGDVLESQTLPTGGDASLSWCAVAEFFRRKYQVRGRSISSDDDAFACVQHFGSYPVEYFFVICLNGAHNVIEVETISQGIVNKTLVHPREVFLPAIKRRSAAVIIGHNHPSGELTPSQDDIDITKRLKEAGIILGIPVLDHLIVAQKGHISLLKEGHF